MHALLSPGTTAIRSKSSSRLASRDRHRSPSNAPSERASPRNDDDNDNDLNDDTSGPKNNQSPSDTHHAESPEADDGRGSTASGEQQGGGGLLGKDFDEEVERQRAREVAAEWSRKRGSGERTKTREKVHERSAAGELFSPFCVLTGYR